MAFNKYLLKYPNQQEFIWPVDRNRKASKWRTCMNLTMALRFIAPEIQ